MRFWPLSMYKWSVQTLYIMQRIFYCYMVKPALIQLDLIALLKYLTIWKFASFKIQISIYMYSKSQANQGRERWWHHHQNYVIMRAMGSQIPSLAIVYSTVYSRRRWKNITAPRYRPLGGEFTGDRWFPAQRASNAENVSIWWRHRVYLRCQSKVSRSSWCHDVKISRKLVDKYFRFIVAGVYSISQEICTRFCCALFCCGYAIIHNEFTWSIYPYSPGLLCWHCGNR